LDLTRIDKGQRLLALQALLHAADLSNPCKKWEIHVQWTHAIVAEFFSQGDLERHVGLEVCVRARAWVFVCARARKREREHNMQDIHARTHACICIDISQRSVRYRGTPDIYIHIYMHMHTR